MHRPLWSMQSYQYVDKLISFPPQSSSPYLHLFFSQNPTITTIIYLIEHLFSRHFHFSPVIKDETGLNP